MKRILSVDTEMTARENGRICQLAWIDISGPVWRGGNAWYAVDEMSPSAGAVTGLTVQTLDALSGGRRFEDTARETYALLQKADLIVGHSVMADIRILQAEFARLHMDFAPKEVFCVRDREIELRRDRDHARIGWMSLERLLAMKGISPEQVRERAISVFGGETRPHDARYDACAAAMIFEELRGSI